MTEIKKQLTALRNAVDNGADGLRQKLDDLQAQIEETLRSMRGRIPPPKGGGRAAFVRRANGSVSALL